MKYEDFSAYMAQSADLLRACANMPLQKDMERAVGLCVRAIAEGKPILVCGNGGSASDAMHIAGELVARFLIDRKALNCICLSSNPAMLTAWANDVGYDTVFSRQVEAHGSAGGTLIALSTSGNSVNVVKACETAKSMGLSVISLTGEGGGKLAGLSDVLLAAPSRFTPMIQQAHLCFYHYLCEQIEARCAEAQG